MVYYQNKIIRTKKFRKFGIIKSFLFSLCQRNLRYSL
jgi:hypothetical protein